MPQQQTPAQGMPGMSDGMMPGMMMPDMDPALAERHFLSGMVPHHASAVTMSEWILEHSQDQKVRTWAEGIIKSQNQEIELMNRMLQGRGGALPQPAAMMEQMGNQMQADLERSADPERAFVELMIPHHAQAVVMSAHVLVSGEDPEVLELARQIATAQVEEIYQFKQWLAQR